MSSQVEAVADAATASTFVQGIVPRAGQLGFTRSSAMNSIQ